MHFVSFCLVFGMITRLQVALRISGRRALKSGALQMVSEPITGQMELSAMRGKVLRVWEPPLDPTGQSATCAGATS